MSAVSLNTVKSVRCKRSTERNKGERNGDASVVYGAVRMGKPAASFKMNKQWQTVLEQKQI
jgi:hypothetical protein